MPLESLLELVKTLSDRIDEHGPALRQSEALTRYALIDPLLRELGWDTSDPDMVIPEYRSGNGRADYALMNDGSPAMMVESKGLGTPLRDTVLSQGINYCLMEGTSYFSVTDGRIWEIYETHKPVPIDEKRIVRFDIKDSPAQVCLSVLALWRYSLETGRVIEVQTPVLPLSPYQTEPSQPLPTEEITPQPVSVVPMIDDGMDWQPLSGFEPPLNSRPAEISFPDNSTAKITNWRSMLVECARWLVNGGYLSESNCPIKSPYAHGYYIIHTSPTHSSGKSFRRGHQVGSLYIEAHSDRAIHSVSKTCRVIGDIGQDPAQFKVRLS